MRRARLGVALAGLALAAGASAEGESELFTFQSLAFPERTWARLVADLDGDGRLDLLLVVPGGEPGSWGLRSCRQQPDGTFSGACPGAPLAGDVRAFDVCSRGRGAAAALVLLTDAGARLAELDDGLPAGPTLPLPIASVLTATDPGVPTHLPLCFDLDADGRDELVVPTRHGPALHSLAANAGPARVLASPPRVTHHPSEGETSIFQRGRSVAPSLQTRITTAGVFAEDFDGDGRRDVVTVLDNTVRAFLQRADGGFRAQPDVVVSRAKLPSGPSREPRGEQTSFADLDGDGRADLVVLRWGFDERTRRDRSIYYARGDGSYPEEADQLVRSESIIPGTAMHDLDGDGRRELVVPYFHVAPAQAVRVLTQQALKLQLRIFRMRPEGRYGQQEGNPFARVDARLVLEYKLDVLGLLLRSEERPEGPLAPLIVVEADVNGDGFADVLADDGDDTLRIFLGNERAQYASRPDHRVALESAWAFDVVDANADGRSDVITWYGAGHVREGVEPLPAGKAARKRAEHKRRQEGGAQRAEPPPETRVKLLLSRSGRAAEAADPQAEAASMRATRRSRSRSMRAASSASRLRRTTGSVFDGRRLNHHPG